jgi:uncharacterized protein with NAD-binding domain and iron-sulfur cluster
VVVPVCAIQASCAADTWINWHQLWISTPGSLDVQPDAATAIPNLALAASYVRTDHIDVDCMECANEAGRRAANAIRSSARSSATPAIVFLRQLPGEWAGLRNLDVER